MNDIRHHAYITLDNKVMLLVGENYAGVPLFGAPVDILICKEYIFNKYKDCFLKPMFKEGIELILLNKEKKNGRRKT